MKRRIQGMAAAALMVLAVVFIPECGVNVFAEETAENKSAQELAADSTQLAQDAQAAADEFAVQAQAAQQELAAAMNEAQQLTNAAATQEEIEAAAASAVRYLEAKAAAEELTEKAEQAADNAEHAKNVAQIHAEDAAKAVPVSPDPSVDPSVAVMALPELPTMLAQPVQPEVLPTQASFFPYVATPEEIRMLASLIYCEAGNQPYEGKVAVASVVLNRMRSGKYANDMRSVIYQRWQFTPATTGWLDSVIASGKASEECYRAAQDALAGVQPVGDAVHFMRKELHGGIRIADHCFWGSI